MLYLSASDIGCRCKDNTYSWYIADKQSAAGIFAVCCFHLLLLQVNRAIFVACIGNIANITVNDYLYAMDESDGYTRYTDVPEPFQAVQQCLDSFVAVNYETALGMVAGTGVTPEELIHYRGKILDIIRNNPPLASVTKYYGDGREDYLWYSDFYDDITKEVYHKYRTFIKPADEITVANYAGELAKVDLPYFRELVNLVSLERLRIRCKSRLPVKEDDTEENELDIEVELEEEPVEQDFVDEEPDIDEADEIEVIAGIAEVTIPDPVSISTAEEAGIRTENKESGEVKDELQKLELSAIEQIQAPESSLPQLQTPVQPKPKPKRLPPKRSYEPKLNNEQYGLLADYIETIRLFRRPVKVTQLKKLLSGKLPEPLQVANQKSLVYLFDELSGKGYIKDTWMSVATGNKDFISFRSEGNIRRYGSEIHYIPIGQMMNDRKRNEREYIHGIDSIDELIELIEESREG